MTWAPHAVAVPKALIKGLTPVTSASFRYRKTVKDVPGEWSQTIAAVVR